VIQFIQQVGQAGSFLFGEGRVMFDGQRFCQCWESGCSITYYVWIDIRFRERELEAYVNKVVSHLTTFQAPHRDAYTTPYP
jgi:hypothetical protein